MRQDFLDLDVISVCEIFRLKSHQEEVSDFSFSFGQTDVCEGLIAWVQVLSSNIQSISISSNIQSISISLCSTISTTGSSTSTLSDSMSASTRYQVPSLTSAVPSLERTGEREHEEEILQALTCHHQPRTSLRC